MNKYEGMCRVCRSNLNMFEKYFCAYCKSEIMPKVDKARIERNNLDIRWSIKVCDLIWKWMEQKNKKVPEKDFSLILEVIREIQPSFYKIYGLWKEDDNLSWQQQRWKKTFDKDFLKLKKQISFYQKRLQFRWLLDQKNKPIIV